jgi:hypothetical protein
MNAYATAHANNNESREMRVPVSLFPRWHCHAVRHEYGRIKFENQSPFSR